MIHSPMVLLFDGQGSAEHQSGQPWPFSKNVITLLTKGSKSAYSYEPWHEISNNLII